MCQLSGHRSRGRPVRLSDIQPSEVNLWRHEAVLEDLMTDHSILPVRFGTVFADEFAPGRIGGALRRFCRRSRSSAGPCGAGVAGVVGCRAGCRPPARGLRKQRRAYMLARAEEECDNLMRQRQAEAYATSIHRRLARLSDESTKRLLGPIRGI